MRIQAAALENAAAWAHLFGKKAKSLHQGQIDFCDDPATKKVGCWGRRCGKSIALGEVYIPRWALKHPETEIYIMSRTQAQANIIFEYMLSVLGPGTSLEPYVDSLKWSPFPTLTLRTGVKITAKNLAYAGRNVRGFSADLAVIDESAFIPDSTMDEAVYPLLAASKIAESVEISTPNGLNHFHRSWMDGQPGGDGYRHGTVKSWRLPTWMNPFVNREYLRAQKTRVSRMAWDVEYGATFREDQGSQFPWTLIEKCLRDVTRPKERQAGLHIPPANPLPGHRYCTGYDPADMHDRAAWVTIDATTRPWPVVDITDLAGIGYVAQKEEALTRVHRYNEAELLIDQTNNVSHLHHIQDEYAKAWGFQFTNEAKRELIDNLRTTMEHTDLIIPYIPIDKEESGAARQIDDLVRELRFYVRSRSKSGKVMLGAPEGEDQFDDYCTATALAVWQAGVSILPSSLNFMDW